MSAGFRSPEVVNVIYESLRFAQRERELKLLAYVIMENHLHLIASAPDLPEVAQRFKSFTARQIVDHLRSKGESTLLSQLRFHKLRDRPESDYQVWEEGCHPIQIGNDAIMWQKLEYVHDNPRRRGYVDDPTHWRYSSARNYARQPGLIDVITDWM